MNIKPGQNVAFSQAVIRRMGWGREHADARGVVLSVTGRVAAVDWRGTWIAHEDGGTVRHVPTNNLTPILANGVVFGD